MIQYFHMTQTSQSSSYCSVFCYCPIRLWTWTASASSDCRGSHLQKSDEARRRDQDEDDQGRVFKCLDVAPGDVADKMHRAQRSRHGEDHPPAQTEGTGKLDVGKKKIYRAHEFVEQKMNCLTRNRELHQRNTLSAQSYDASEM